jgi:serine/threonine-protein kinase SRPK3
MLMGQPIIPAKIHPDSVPYAHTLLFGTYPRHLVERGKFSSKYGDGEMATAIHSGILFTVR